MNEKRFYQLAKHEHTTNGWYYVLAKFFHNIEMRYIDDKKHKSLPKESA